MRPINSKRAQTSVEKPVKIIILLVAIVLVAFFIIKYGNDMYNNLKEIFPTRFGGAGNEIDTNEIVVTTGDYNTYIKDQSMYNPLYPSSTENDKQTTTSSKQIFSIAETKLNTYIYPGTLVCATFVSQVLSDFYSSRGESFVKKDGVIALTQELIDKGATGYTRKQITNDNAKNIILPGYIAVFNSKASRDAGGSGYHIVIVEGYDSATQRIYYIHDPGKKTKGYVERSSNTLTNLYAIYRIK